MAASYKMKGSLHTNDLLRGLKARDPEVFAGVYRHYFPILFAAARKYIDDKSLAEEMIQDVFLNIWEKDLAPDHPAALKSYLFRALINRVMNHFQREKRLRHHHEALQHLSEESYLCTFIEEQELRENIHKAIEALPDRCKKIFKMSRFDGMKNQQIADSLQLSVKTIENQMTIALRQLRATLLENDSQTLPPDAKLKILLFLLGV
ncbi:RNA polymerase sigma-70 factor [Chitinophaga sp. XS-30]|nr:RNA polymerase sigma-70 factor [Chitinophaga sp. XS-30]